MKTVFITGCATGFGRRLAEDLLAAGHRVIATDPREAAIADLRSEGCLVLPLDVRHPDKVRAAVERTLAWAEPDVLVNNGGYAVFGSQEEMDLELIRDLFDVNVLGVGRITQALLPTLRKQQGTIVQLSSVAGRSVFPESGWYAATKYAIEAMSEALFQECCTFGIKVRLIQPGAFDTQFVPTAIKSSPPRSEASPYAALHPTWDAAKFGLLEDPQEPARVAAAIIDSLDDERPFFRVPVGDDAVRMMKLRDALKPDEWMELQGRRNGLDRPYDEGDPLAPATVLSAAPDDLQLALQAYEGGHFAHWEGSEEGRSALAILAGLAGT